MRFGIRLYSEGSSDLIGENWQREILSPDKVWKMREYCMYFPFFVPKAGAKDPLSSRRRFIQRFLRLYQASASPRLRQALSASSSGVS